MAKLQPDPGASVDSSGEYTSCFHCSRSLLPLLYCTGIAIVLLHWTGFVLLYWYYYEIVLELYCTAGSLLVLW